MAGCKVNLPFDAAHRNRCLTKSSINDKLKKPYMSGSHGFSDETRSYAMGIYEPCQVGNKAALSRTFHVP